MQAAYFGQFVRQDSGAVTVDWVVLSAAVVGLALASAAAVRSGAGALADQVTATLTATSVADLGDLAGSDGSACDWLCAYSAFLAAEEPNFSVEEFGMTVEDMAQARWDEFESYPSQFLRDHAAGLSGYESQPEPYRAYYAAEIAAIEEILSTRGESL